MINLKKIRKEEYNVSFVTILISQRPNISFFIQFKKSDTFPPIIDKILKMFPSCWLNNARIDLVPIDLDLMQTTLIKHIDWSYSGGVKLSQSYCHRLIPSTAVAPIIYL